MPDWLNIPITGEGTGTVATALIVTMAILVGGAVLTRALNSGTRAVLFRSRPSALGYETARLLRRSVVGVMWIVLLLLVLKAWGVSIGGLWTFLVSIATLVGVGFLATWTMVSNVTASFFLTIWRPFHMGDGVELLPENLKGKIVERNLMFTTLEQEDGLCLQVPNNMFFQKMFRVDEIHEQYDFDFAEVAARERRARDARVRAPKTPAHSAAKASVDTRA